METWCVVVVPKNAEPIEENIEHFLSDDDEEVREVRRIGKQQIEEDNDGAENTNNDEDMQQAGGDSGFEDIPQAAQSGAKQGNELGHDGVVSNGVEGKRLAE
nr:hypothetical protein Iba_chr14eCG5730 [Ipomoea batatas]